MGIFKPTKIKADIVIYTKWCIECAHPEWLLAINLYALHNDLDVQVIRTQYKPADHDKATEFWASRSDVKDEDAENYSTFVVHDGVYKMKEFLKMINGAENKLVQEGEAKNDMQRLSEAKRSGRKNSVARKVTKVKAQVERKE